MTLPQKQLHIHSQNQDQNDSVARAFLSQSVFILKLRAVPPPSRQPLLLPTVGSNFVLYLLAYSPDLSKEWDPDLWPPQLSNYGQGKSDEGKWDFSPSRSANLTVGEKLIGKDILPHTSWRKAVLWFRTGSRSEKQEEIFVVVSVYKAYFYKLSERTSHVCWALTQFLWISNWPLISFSSPRHENSIF